MRWREEIPDDMAELGLQRRQEMPVRIEQAADLSVEAWRVADEFGWAKTYDAEYVALARILDCRLVTTDGRLRRGADRLGFVITPAEL
jgi:predicted nucleic acid-binding protein